MVHGAQIAIIGKRAKPQFAIVPLGRLARRTDPERHVGILGVGENELAATGGVGVNGGKFAIERFLHDVF